MNFWLILLIIYSPLALKQLLFWLFLWQNREYRGDKMLDYLRLPESYKVVFDLWTNIRLFLGLISYLNLANPSWNIDIIYQIGFATWIFELAIFLRKVFISKTAKLPVFTSKATLVFSLSFLSIASLTTLVDGENLVSSFFGFNLLILLTPIVIGYWLLIIFPLDWFTKFRIFMRARQHRLKMTNLEVVAVSGAYGKTTTKEILDQLLSPNKKVEKTIKNQNSGMSCARKTLSLKSDTEIFICELGSYKRGDGNEICQFIKPNTAIITGLNLQHYSLFGSKENIILAESEALHHLPKGGLAIINWSSQMCREIPIPENINVVKCAILSSEIEQEEIDYLAKDISTTLAGTDFKIQHKSSTWHIQTNLFSNGSVENILICFAFAHQKGLPITQVLAQLKQLEPAEGRLQVTKKDWGNILYNAYNNPDGLRNTFELAQSNKSQKIVVIDDIMELGSQSKHIHIQVARQIFATKPALVVLLGRSFSSILSQELENLGYDTGKIEFWNGKNTHQLKTKLHDQLYESDDSLLLLLGFQSKHFLDIK